ncbi:MAG: hypothetical protein ACR2KO_08205 [Geodermatophilaceae bacterium]
MLRPNRSATRPHVAGGGVGLVEDPVPSGRRRLPPTQLEEIVLRILGMAPHFQLELTRRGRMDHLTVRVEARTDCPPERRDPAAAELVSTVKDPETLERSHGKLQRLIDRR